VSIGFRSTAISVLCIPLTILWIVVWRLAPFYLLVIAYNPVPHAPISAWGWRAGVMVGCWWLSWDGTFQRRRLATQRQARRVRAVQGARCAAWGCMARGRTIDHVIPHAAGPGWLSWLVGGPSIWCNFKPLCRTCNSRKSDRITGGYVRVPRLFR
jgi:hypothetical protein